MALGWRHTFCYRQGSHFLPIFNLGTTLRFVTAKEMYYQPCKALKLCGLRYAGGAALVNRCLRLLQTLQEAERPLTEDLLTAPLSPSLLGRAGNRGEGFFSASRAFRIEYSFFPLSLCLCLDWSDASTSHLSLLIAV